MPVAAFNAGFGVTISTVAVAGVQVVLVGGVHVITWTTTGSSTAVDILYSPDGITFFIIESNVANVGSYSWTPTIDQLSASGVIRIRDSNDTSSYGDKSVIVATTSGGGTNTALWFRLQELAVNDGLELSRP